MDEMQYFYELYEALPRCGPGDNQSTRRAFSAITDVPKQPKILDIGCGPGVQTIELAKLSHGEIIALDNHQAFLDRLVKNAVSDGIMKQIVPKNMSMLEMDFANDTFDIIWSEGALYFMGFQQGLKKCHQLLKSHGYLAVTEIVYLAKDLPAPLVNYFENEYPDIKLIQDNITLIQKVGFQLISHFTLAKSTWLDEYYVPIERELNRLIDKYAGNEVAQSVFAEVKKEIEIYKKYSDYFSYEFFIMQK